MPKGGSGTAVWRPSCAKTIGFIRFLGSECAKTIVFIRCLVLWVFFWDVPGTTKVILIAENDTSEVESAPKTSVQTPSAPPPWGGPGWCMCVVCGVVWCMCGVVCGVVCDGVVWWCVVVCGLRMDWSGLE